VSLDSRLRGVFAAVFPVDGLALTDSDSPETIEGWDSLAHLNLLLTVESEFGVQFSPDEMAALTSFGAIRQRLAGGDNG
jgi:acyl carrier protein